MANLLPQNEKKKIRREYAFRRVNVLLAVIFASIIIAIIMLFPSYIITSIHTSEMNMEKSSDISIEREEIESAVENTQQQLKALDPEKLVNESFVEITKEIISSADSSIEITNITYEKTLEKKSEEKTEEVLRSQISGIASNRSVLVNFKRKLEQSKMFSKVELPVSNLAQDVDISFNLDLVISKEDE